MGLIIVAFVIGFVLLAMAFPLVRRVRGNTAGYYVLVLHLSMAFFSFFSGLVSLLALLGANDAALLCSRLASVMMALGCSALVGFALSFSLGAQIWGLVGMGLGLLIAAVLTWRLLFTPSYLAAVAATADGRVLRIEGNQYGLFSDFMAVTALVSAVAHAVRAATSKDRIHRQRSAIAFLGAVLGPAMVWLFARAVPSVSGYRWTFSLLPLAALVIASTVSYAFSLSRLFDWRAMGLRFLGYAALVVVVGVPTGFAIALLNNFTRLSPMAPYVGAVLLFLVANASAKRFLERFFERLGGRGEYREELESSLSHVDLALGRDSVLADIYRLLSETLDFSDFTVMIEDDRGVLRSVFAPTGAKAVVERGGALAETLEGSGATVLLKSEAVTQPAYSAARGEVLGLFDSLKAEALILAREGRRVIGIFALGSRRTGADYTDYDYETFRSIYGKLFVFAYYLKNVARESILHTVDRELALSDQIIRFALENVDQVEHPRVDAAWTQRSTRSLGGDFVDFVKLSPDHWFFVMGDVSGKGLSASMNMLILKSMIRTFLKVEKEFAGLVARVNAFIKQNLPSGTFFAGIFGYFDFEKGSLYFLNCGVPTLLLYSPSFDTFVEVQGEGKILGFVRDVKPYLKPRKLALPPGSALVASTDGVTDAESLRGERYGKDRLKKAVLGRLAAGSRAIADSVVEDLMAFTDRKQEDDITLVVMKFSERREP
jgi:hypothetical protein